jgi:hypothetical protein
LAANGQRRDQTKSQKALVGAAYVERSNLEQLDLSLRKAASTLGVHASRVSEALLILRYAHDLAEAVLSGAATFSVAYEEARSSVRQIIESTQLCNDLKKCVSDADEGERVRIVVVAAFRFSLLQQRSGFEFGGRVGLVHGSILSGVEVNCVTAAEASRG